jgi:hypothetical protein
MLCPKGNFCKFNEMTLNPEQIKIYKSLLPSEKLEIAENLYRSAWNLKETDIKAKHPEWSKEKVAKKVAEIFLYARS